MRLIDADRLMEWIQGLSWRGRILTVPDLRVICNELAKDNNVPGNGWISVKDRLPEDETVVMAYVQHKIGWYRIFAWHDMYGWHSSAPEFDENESDYVTNWMPLPEPPEVSE